MALADLGWRSRRDGGMVAAECLGGATVGWRGLRWLYAADASKQEKVDSYFAQKHSPGSRVVSLLPGVHEIAMVDGRNEENMVW